MKGRNTVDNILGRLLLIKRKPQCTIKIDLRKAFNSIAWSFLQQVLDGLGFPQIFVGWIMECVSTTPYSISSMADCACISKRQKGFVKETRYPPIALLCDLSTPPRFIKFKTAKGSSFKFHLKCSKLGITHLALAMPL